MRLPRSVDELRGLRAARWIRESTRGQVDRFGPDAQREQQDRAIERHGLLDTGIAWTVAHSGRTIAGTAQFSEMLEAAGVRYDILVVGYVSRFARDLRTAVNARHELHAAGAAILFADERLLSSDEDAWEAWARESVEAEGYSRRLAKRIREGYAAKLRRERDPGGRPPFGFRRTADLRHLVEPDPAALAVGVSAFELAAAGILDREIAARLELPLHTLRGVLTSPLYVGRLRDSGAANWPAPVDPGTWNRVAGLRRDRNHRSPGRPETRRTYALPMLECAACGRRLVGDKDRYRHLEACEAFAAAAAQPERPVRGQHGRIPGQSYGREEYEAAVLPVLERVRLHAGDVAEAVAAYHAVADPQPDLLALARIEQDRDRALERFRRDRDTPALEGSMARLDVDEREASAPRVRAELTPAEVRGYLGNLAAWWTDALPTDRKALAETLFETVAVLGIRTMRITPTRDALDLGLAEAFGTDDVEMVGARGVVLTISISSPPELLRRIRLVG